MQPVISAFLGITFPTVIVATDLEKINPSLYALLKSCDDTGEMADVTLYQLELFCAGVSGCDFLDSAVIEKVFEDFKKPTREQDDFFVQCSKIESHDPAFYALLTRNNLQHEVFRKLHFVLVRLYHEIAEITARKKAS